MSAENAGVKKCVTEIRKLGHRKDFGGKNAIEVIKSRMPNLNVATQTQMAEFVLAEINRQMNGNRQRTKSYFERLKEIL